jgi:MFS transporter, DHA2 family, metal-tetracycline-proton antiporter
MIGSRLLLVTLAFLAFIVVSNNSAASIAQPAIGQAFGAGPADVGWVVFGFGTTFAIGTAVWGGLAGRLGIGRSLAIGVVVFSAGSALASVAPSLPVLIGARAIQGIGAGVIPTLAATAIATRFDGAARARALGAIIAGVVLGIALGPLLGGVALELVGWQGPVAFGVIAAPAAALLYAGTDRDGDPDSRIDLVGVILVAIAVAATTFTLNRLPVVGLAIPSIVPIAVLAVALPLIIGRSDRAGTFVPRRIVLDPAFTGVVALGSVGMSAFLGTLVLVPVAAAGAHGLTGLALGLVILPLAIVAAVASLTNATVQERLGRRRTTIVSLAALSVGAAATGILGAEAPPIVTAAVLIPTGLGFGLLQAPLVNELTASFGNADRPVALGLYNLMFFLGGAAGAAIATAFVQGAVELPFLAGREIAGFSTSLLLLALGPAVAVAVHVVRQAPPAEPTADAASRGS